MKRNHNFSRLQAGYLFPEINRRKNELLQKNPDAKIISLGIGNTTEPLSPFICSSMQEAAKNLGTREGYSGYGDEQGFDSLRAKVADKLYNGIVAPEEVFISDGAKCDIGRLQVLFGAGTTLAAQDPSYPVYVDGGVILGQTGDYNKENGQFAGIQYIESKPENNFFPDLSKLERTDVIYWCSPNNPAGFVSTREQLQELVAFAKANKSIIVFDSAYSMFIQDPELPRSIFEIDGAREVAIEVSSFSKSAGFTGVRLGWSIVPNELCFDDGTPVRNDWNRVMTTIFNGASNVVQHTGLACLEDEGIKEMQTLVTFYMENAKIIKTALNELDIETHGGDNSPYIWAAFPGKDSWDVFSDILNAAHVVTTPGSGFGPGGEGFVRFSAFGSRSDVEEAVERLKKVLGK